MTKEQIKKHGEVMKWFIDNSEKGVCRKDHKTKNWHFARNPQFNIKDIYVQNDEYAEYRKALVDGKTIQYKPRNYSWENILIEPSFQLPVEKYRVKPEAPKYWKPKNSEKFYYIEGTRICTTEYNNADFAKELVLIGNVFKTKDGAEKELELRLATQRLKEVIWEANGGKFISLNPNSIDFIVSVNNLLQVIYCTSIQSNQNWMYIKDKETAEKVLKENRKDFEIYYGL